MAANVCAVYRNVPTFSPASLPLVEHEQINLFGSHVRLSQVGPGNQT